MKKLIVVEVTGDHVDACTTAVNQLLRCTLRLHKAAQEARL